MELSHRLYSSQPLPWRTGPSLGCCRSYHRVFFAAAPSREVGARGAHLFFGSKQTRRLYLRISVLGGSAPPPHRTLHFEIWIPRRWSRERQSLARRRDNARHSSCLLHSARLTGQIQTRRAGYICFGMNLRLTTVFACPRMSIGILDCIYSFFVRCVSMKGVYVRSVVSLLSAWLAGLPFSRAMGCGAALPFVLWISYLVL